MQDAFGVRLQLPGVLAVHGILGVEQFLNDSSNDLITAVKSLSLNQNRIDGLTPRDQFAFVLDGNVAAFLGTKNHLNVFIYDPIAPDPTGLINQGHGNATARSIQIFEGDQPDETALLALFRAVIANNRAGGWRKLAT